MFGVGYADDEGCVDGCVDGCADGYVYGSVLGNVYMSKDADEQICMAKGVKN